MPEPVAYPIPADRWLGEFLARASTAYRTSPDYRRRLDAERAPMFARSTSPHFAA